MGIEVLRRAQIDAALQKSSRQYLAGDLSRPQALEAIFDRAAEAGFTRYSKYTAELPHYHENCTEYEFIFQGRSKYLDMLTGETTEVAEGDFFVIRPGTRYFQKSPAGTEILFIKIPGGDDKRVVPLTSAQRLWGEDYDHDL